MKNLLKITLLMTLLLSSGCSLFSFGYKAEYKVETSMVGADVYLSNGVLMGQTPLDLTWESLSEVIDGRFVTIIIKKDGYFTRVVLFDTSDSVNIKIDLKVDKNFKELMVKESHNRELMLKAKIEANESKNRVISNENQITRIRNEKIQIKNEKLQKSLDAYHEKYQQLLADLEKSESINSNLNVSLKSTKFDLKSALVRPAIKTQLNCTEKKTAKVKARRCPASIVKYYPNKRMNGVITDLLGIQFLIINGKLNEAKKKILKVEEKHPQVAALYTLLAYVEMQSNKFTEARKHIRRSLVLNKHDKMANRMSALLKDLSEGDGR